MSVNLTNQYKEYKSLKQTKIKIMADYIITTKNLKSTIKKHNDILSEIKTNKCIDIFSFVEDGDFKFS